LEPSSQSSRKDMGELEKDNHFNSAGTLCSSEKWSSDWEDDFELDNQSTSVAYHLGNVVINLLALCVPFVALLLFRCGDLELNPGPTSFIQCHNCGQHVSIRVKKCSCGQNMRKRTKAFVKSCDFVQTVPTTPQ